MAWDYEERGKVSWRKFGAVYVLSYTYYYYDDPVDRVAGSGVKSLTLDITKGKHEFGEFDVDALGKRNRARLIAEAEGDSEKFSGE